MVKPEAKSVVGEYKWGFHDDEKPLYKAEKGLSEGIVREISKIKSEPEWNN